MGSGEDLEKLEKERIKLVSEPVQMDDGEAAEHDPLVGKVIAGHLEILSILGAGGMSTVYKAQHLLLDRLVAVKLVQAGQFKAKATMRFQQEAKAATKLNHPNIATVREFGVDEEGSAYLVMDFVEGMPLSDAIKKASSLDAARTRKLMIQICEGLKHAHEAGVVHRDLKPANIILSPGEGGQETAKLVDFGIAKIVDEESQANLTQTGEVFGTPNYMSPEQCLGKKADRRSDVYSLGCVMYECLTGKPPFAADSALETLMKHVNDAPDLKRREIPADLAIAIERCMAKDPEDRFQSIDELINCLLNPEQTQKLKPKKKLGRGKVIAIAAMAIVIGAGLGAASAIMQSHDIQAFLFPKPWNTLAMQAANEASRGPGNYDPAKALFLKAVTQAEEGGASDADREDLYRKFGMFLTNSGDRRNALKYLGKALALNEKHQEDFFRGSLHDWIATVYLDMNDYKQAEDHAREAIAIKTRTIGENHEYTLFAVSRLGDALWKNGKRQEAEDVYRKAWEIAGRVHPNKDDIDCSNTAYSLGDVMALNGKVKESIPILKEAISVSAKVLGPDDPTTIQRRDYVVRLLKDKGHPWEASMIQKEFSSGGG